MSETTMTRRGFLKTAAAMGTVAAATGAFASNFTDLDPACAADADEEIIIHTACRACIIDCGAIVTVRNGKVVKIEGDPEDPINKGRMCAKGLSGIQALYNPNRLKYPMRRAGERGENKWERISWKEGYRHHRRCHVGVVPEG